MYVNKKFSLSIRRLCREGNRVILAYNLIHRNAIHFVFLLYGMYTNDLSACVLLVLTYVSGVIRINNLEPSCCKKWQKKSRARKSEGSD